MIESGVFEEDAHIYAEGVRRGGSLVAAKVEEDKILSAQAILDQSRSVNVPARRAAYNSEGWKQFDDRAEPYTLEQIDQERMRYRNESR